MIWELTWEHEELMYAKGPCCLRKRANRKLEHIRKVSSRFTKAIPYRVDDTDKAGMGRVLYHLAPATGAGHWHHPSPFHPLIS